jgi:hypothetical protein
MEHLGVGVSETAQERQLLLIRGISVLAEWRWTGRLAGLLRRP